MRFRTIARAALLLPAFLACASDAELLSPTTGALVQFVNASSSGSVFTTTDGNEVGTGLGFQQSSNACVLVPAGTQSFGFTANGSTVASVNSEPLVAGQRYTVILTGTGSTRTALVLPEITTQQATGNYAVRFVNATNQTGNIYVTTQGAVVAGSPNATLLQGSATGGTSGTNAYLVFTNTTNRVRFYGAASSTTPLVDYIINNPSPTTGTTIVFATNELGGVTAFAVNPCTAF